MKLSKLEYYSLCGKVNSTVRHPTHITIYSFFEEQSLTQGFINYQEKLHFNSKKY